MMETWLNHKNAPNIKSLIPVVLDLKNVEYSCWSNLFRVTARAYNVLHHIDPTINESPSTIGTTYWSEVDGIVLRWICATISPYLLVRILNQKSATITAMTAWERLRDLCQHYNNRFMRPTPTPAKKRMLNIDLNEEYVGEEIDLISGLPDDVLVYMLSLTDMKTAGRSSLLSKRWSHVWTHVRNLDFKDPETTATAMRLKFIYYAQPEMDRYVERVNKVITANRAPYLDTLRIYFPLNVSYADDIDNWLKFAFSKEVRNLELNFIAPPANSRINFFNIFPTNNHALIMNTTLKSLHLQSVIIKGPLLQWVVTNCLNLERLSLHFCKASVDDKHQNQNQNQKLVVSSLNIKHLEFYHSFKFLNIEQLDLSAPNLTSLIIFESEIRVHYRNVPSFVDATFGGSYFHHIFHDLDTLSGFSSQLKKLSIPWYKVHSASSGFPSFVNVELLEITFDQRDDDLSSMTSLIEACPLLHTFKLKLMCRNQLQWARRSLSPNDGAEKVNAIRSHQHLKAVEYVGYAGCASAAELALCLTQHAPMLQTFILDTHQPQFLGKPHKICTRDYRDQMAIVRSSAELLAKRIKARQGLVDVVIL